jgi:hypothetical protein
VCYLHLAQTTIRPLRRIFLKSVTVTNDTPVNRRFVVIQLNLVNGAAKRLNSPMLAGESLTFPFFVKHPIESITVVVSGAISYTKDLFPPETKIITVSEVILKGVEIMV